MFTTNMITFEDAVAIYMSRNSRVFITLKRFKIMSNTIYMSRNSRVFTTKEEFDNLDE